MAQSDNFWKIHGENGLRIIKTTLIQKWAGDIDHIFYKSLYTNLSGLCKVYNKVIRSIR